MALISCCFIEINNLFKLDCCTVVSIKQCSLYTFYWLTIPLKATVTHKNCPDFTVSYKTPRRTTLFYSRQKFHAKTDLIGTFSLYFFFLVIKVISNKRRFFSLHSYYICTFCPLLDSWQTSALSGGARLKK